MNLLFQNEQFTEESDDIKIRYLRRHRMFNRRDKDQFSEPNHLIFKQATKFREYSFSMHELAYRFSRHVDRSLITLLWRDKEDPRIKVVYITIKAITGKSLT